MVPVLAAGELLHVAEPFLEKNLHPTVIVKGYAKVRRVVPTPQVGRLSGGATAMSWCFTSSSATLQVPHTLTDPRSLQVTRCSAHMHCTCELVQNQGRVSNGTQSDLPEGLKDGIHQLWEGACACTRVHVGLSFLASTSPPACAAHARACTCKHVCAGPDRCCQDCRECGLPNRHQQPGADVERRQQLRGHQVHAPVRDADGGESRVVQRTFAPLVN